MVRSPIHQLHNDISGELSLEDTTYGHSRKAATYPNIIATVKELVCFLQDLQIANSQIVLTVGISQGFAHTVLK